MRTHTFDHEFEDPFVTPEGKRIYCSALITVRYEVVKDSISWEHHTVYEDAVEDVEIADVEFFATSEDGDEVEIDEKTQEFFLRQFDPRDHHSALLDKD